MQHKRKKKTRMRGTNAHKWGSSKKHRGSGNRGGIGNAGSGKRGSAKRMLISGGVSNAFGKNGFNPHKKSVIKAVTIGYIQDRLNTLIEQGVVKKEKDLYVLNLKDMGYDKLISRGTVVKKFKITAKFASQGVVNKVKESGGEVVLPTQKTPE